MVLFSCDLVDLLVFMTESWTNYLGAIIFMAMMLTGVSSLLTLVIRTLGQSVSTVAVMYKTDSSFILKKQENND